MHEYKLVLAEAAKPGTLDLTKVEMALHGIELAPGVVEAVRAAVNSRSSIFIYGAPGNGKTTLARRIPALLGGPIVIPVALDIGGGEPCLRKDLVEVVGLFRAREISIPTNGWFPDRITRVAEAIHERTQGRLIVTVSLDGFEETHDEMRMKGSFKKAHETIRRLREIQGLRVKVNTVLCERNCREILDFMRYVRDLGVDYQSLLLLRGNPINPLYKLPPLDTMRKIGEQLPEILEGYEFGRKGLFRSILRNYQAVKWETQMRTLEEETQVVPCLGGQIHLVVYANGEVAPCEILPSVGSIRKTPLKEILASREWAQVVAGIRRKDCNCTHDCNQQENILFEPRTYPKLLGF